jgi:hypothetical protein
VIEHGKHKRGWIEPLKNAHGREWARAERLAVAFISDYQRSSAVPLYVNDLCVLQGRLSFPDFRHFRGS